MPSRRQSLEMFSSPRDPSSTMRIFSSAEYGGSGAECPLALGLPTLWPVRISVSSSLLVATMNQKSSLRKFPLFVSQALTANTWRFFPRDDAGNDYVKGLKDGLGEKASTIIVKESHL